MKWKKKKMKVSMLITFLAIGAVLAGCSGNNNGAGNGSVNTGGNVNEQNVQEEKPAPTLDPYEVTMLYPGTPQKDEAAVEAAMNKILTEKINATIDIKPIDWGAWGDKTNLIFAGGEKEDIIFTASWFGFNQNVVKGAYLELDGLLEQHGLGTKESLSPFYFEASAVNGKHYAVPTNKELASNSGLLLRKDLVDKYGFELDAIKTMQDMEPLLKIIKENEPDVIPMYMDAGHALPGWISGAGDPMGDNSIPGGIDIESGSTQVTDSLDVEEYIANVKTARDWFQKGYINKDAATTKTASNDLLKAGKIFAVVEGLKPGKDKEVEASLGVPLVQVALTEPTITTGNATNSMLAISRTSEDPERAMMVINLLHTDKELLNLLVFGIEGTHYEKVSDNVIKPLKRDDYNVAGNAWMFGNQFLNFLGDNEDPQKWEKFKQFNESGKASPALGFVFDPEPVKNEVAQLNTVKGQYQASLETGSVDPDKILPEFKAKMEKAGLQKVLDEKQRQLDAFLAGK